MGSNFNFKSFGNEPPTDGGGGRQPTNFPLVRQPSVYSLTFDEFQSTMGGLGKDFGSMNMDELLKSIWSAEENQITGSSTGGGEGLVSNGGYLQRQGSLTLPRTLSQKTVDEVWKDMSKEYGGGKEMNATGSSIMPQRQQTLGEITLEEFLVRAGVVREDAQLAGKPNNNGLLGDLAHVSNNGLGFGYQEANRNSGIMGSRISEDHSNSNGIQASNLLSVNGIRSSHQPLQTSQLQHQQQQPPVFPKQPTLAAYGASMGIPSSGGQLTSTGIRNGMLGISDPSMNSSLLPNTAISGGGIGMVGLGAAGVTVAVASPAVSSDGLGRSNGDASSVSPVPYVFNGGLRGRKASAVEKVVERRQRRMIKNRESAARSRARKQAYTMELEAEVAKLKEENDQLRKKQAEIVELQKNQVQEMMKNTQRGAKRRCLRRTQTGPW